MKSFAFSLLLTWFCLPACKMNTEESPKSISWKVESYTLTIQGTNSYKSNFSDLKKMIENWKKPARYENVDNLSFEFMHMDAPIVIEVIDFIISMKLSIIALKFKCCIFTDKFTESLSNPRYKNFFLNLKDVFMTDLYISQKSMGTFLSFLQPEV